MPNTRRGSPVGDLVVDRSAWPRGPWDEEPEDFVTWRAAGLPAAALRNFIGAWCGYVGVERGHPLFERPRQLLSSLPSHGGYANRAIGDDRDGVEAAIARAYGPGPFWWIGFDCSHGMDLVPGWEGLLAGLSARTKELVGTVSRTLFDGPKYRSLAYVRGRCEELAQRLVEIGRVVS